MKWLKTIEGMSGMSVDDVRDHVKWRFRKLAADSKVVGREIKEIRYNPVVIIYGHKVCI